MCYTEILSLREAQEAKRKRETRQELHESFDEWLEKMEEKMKEKNVSLQDITEAVLSLRQELTQRITEKLVKEKKQAILEQEMITCPKCGKILKARGPIEKTVESLVGEIKIDRPYFYCEACKKGWFPVDEALSLTPGRKQADIQKAIVKLTKEVPYKTACELFKDLTGVSMSDHSAHNITNDVAEGLSALSVAKTREEILGLIESAAQGKKWRPILVLAIDGADVPTRPETAKAKGKGRKKTRSRRAQWQGEWREAKGFRFFLLDDDRIIHILSWHQVQSDDELAASLREIQLANLIPEDKVRLCVIADGARWIWKHVNELFPSAVQVLDYYHCSEHLHKVASLQYAGDPELQSQWIEASIARLFCGESHGIIWGLQRMNPKDTSSASEIDKLIHYLEQHRHRLNYKFLRKAGYPIGSGGIESANKFICHVRLKRSGAWWYIPNANQILALRCAKYNGTFDRVFELYREKS